MAGEFQVMWGSKDAGFSKIEILKGSDGKVLEIPADDKKEVTKKICTRPTAVDWDGDGNIDLVVGNFEGSFYLFRGESGNKFQPTPEVLKCDGRDLRVTGAHSDPFVVDWDADGDFDLLSGNSQGGVEWSENTAGKGKEPALRPFKTLVKGHGHQSIAVEGPADSTRVWADDVNGDGKLDLLVGDRAIFNSPAEGVTGEEMTKKKAAWKKEMDALLEEMSKAPLDADRRPPLELRKKQSDLLASRKEFMKDERTGYVWLLVQK